MSVALGAALYHDYAFVENVLPLQRMLDDFFEDVGGIVQFTIAAASRRKARPPSSYRRDRLVTAVQKGSLYAFRVGTGPRTPDVDVIDLGAHVALPGDVDASRSRGWRYRVDFAAGARATEMLGVQRIVAAFVGLADTISPRAGVVFTAETAAFAGALATGASVGSLTEAQDRRVRETYYAVQELKGGIRGPEWGTFLGPDHVGRLGGLVRLQREAADIKVRGLRGGGAYLQLSDHPPAPDDPRQLDRMARLARFLGAW